TSPTVTLTPTPVPTGTVPGNATQTPITTSLTATPTLSPVPVGTEATVVLQQGLNGYVGSEDTYIHIWNPDTNYCSLNMFRVGYRQQYASLLYFDLSPIPANAQVTEAYLEIYATGWSGSNMAIDAHGVLRRMDICQATWNQASAGNPWGTAGCNNTTTDRTATPDSSVTTQGLDRWYRFRLTALVQDWISGRLANHGIILRGALPASSAIFYFASAQHESIHLRPRLVVTYRLATYTPQASPTHTRIPSLAPISTTNPTATPIQSSTPTQTPSAIPTATTTGTPRPSPTATSTSIPQSSPISTPASAEITVTLQQGYNDYTGCEDTYIYQQESESNYCSLNMFKVGYRQQYTTWLHFDLYPIPANAIVTRATLQVYAAAWGGSDITLEVYRSLRKVNACQATWNQAETGTPWGAPGANDTSTDRTAMPESNGTTSGLAKWYSFDITMLVQDWLNGHFANYGLFLRGASPFDNGIFQFASAEHTSTDLRPKLVITYRLTGTPTPFLTPRLTPVPSGTPQTLILQQGNNGYTGCEDTYIYKYQEPGSTYCALNLFKVGYRQQYTTWLHFDLYPIPANAIVTRATLQVYAAAWGGSDITLEVYRSLRKVNACQATWNQAETGTPWGAPGANDTSTDRTAMPESNGTTSGLAKWYSFDITMLVQDWLNGHFANYGLFLRGASPFDNGIFQFASAEHTSTDLRPKLVITYFNGSAP
ncbi:MAG: DNRLRE domain-containing protein, partial [Anaerolineae bacterium]